MREYTKVDLLRFAKFSKENDSLKPMELLKAYDLKYPELSSKQKWDNLVKALFNSSEHDKSLPKTNEGNKKNSTYFKQ